MDDRVVRTLRRRPPGESESELTQRARLGDESAFAELYRRHRKAAQATARCLLRSNSDADDAVSEAFAGVLSAFRHGRGPQDNFRTYLLACVRNGCRSRRTRPTPMAADMLEHFDSRQPLDGNHAMFEDPERYVEADTVARAFSALSPRWQHALWITEVEERSAVEVGRDLKLSPNATAALTHRARQAFAAAYLSEHVARSVDPACADFAPHLARYVRGRLHGTELDHIESHLIECTSCTDAVSQLRDMNASLRSLLPVTPEALAAAMFSTSGTVGTLGDAGVALGGIGGTVAASGTAVLIKGLIPLLILAPVLMANDSRPLLDSEAQGDTVATVAPGAVAPLTVATLAASATTQAPVTAPAPTSTIEITATSVIVTVPPTVAVTTPAVTRPAVTISAVTLPEVTLPAVTIPALTLPVTVPDIQSVLDPMVQPLLDEVVEPIVQPIVDPVVKMLVPTVRRVVDDAIPVIAPAADELTPILAPAVELTEPLTGLVDEIGGASGLPTGALIGIVRSVLVGESSGSSSTPPMPGALTGVTTTTISHAAPEHPSATVPPPITLPGTPSTDPPHTAPPGASGTTPAGPAVTTPATAAPTAPPTTGLPGIVLPVISVSPIVVPVISLAPITLPTVLGG